MNLIRLAPALSLMLFAAQIGGAQAKVVSAPPEPSLLNMTGQWSRASSLGDLREMRADRDYRELRVWLGFGLTTETQSFILRRANNHWSAFFARVGETELGRERPEARNQSRTLRQVVEELARADRVAAG